VTAVAFGADGQTVLTGSADQTARLWDTSSGRPRGAPLSHEEPVVAVAFSAGVTSWPPDSLIGKMFSARELGTLAIECWHNRSGLMA